MMLDVLAALFLLAGSAVTLIAAIGVARLPDPFLRMHAATKAGVVGAGCVLLGCAFALGTIEAAAKAILATIFLLVTTPIASHLLGRAAYVGGAPLWPGTARDDLAGILPRIDGDIDEPDHGPAAES